MLGIIANLRFVNGNCIACGERYLRSREQTVWLLGAELVGHALGEDSPCDAVQELYNWPRLAVVQSTKGFDLAFAVLGMIAAQVSVFAPLIRRFWKILLIVWLELNDLALGAVDQTSRRVDVGQQYDSLALLELQVCFVARSFLCMCSAPHFY